MLRGTVVALLLAVASGLNIPTLTREQVTNLY
jgi:hypothetical protein